MRSAEHDAGPVCDERLRGSEPKTAAAAGNEVNPVAQSKIHPAILPVRGRAASSKPLNAGPGTPPGEPSRRLPGRKRDHGGRRRYPAARAGTRLAALGVPRPVTGSQPVVAG